MAKLNYGDTVVGHTFSLDGEGKLIKPEKFYCALCGTPGQHYILVRRDDGLVIKLGKTCLRKVGLSYPKSGVASPSQEEAAPVAPPEPVVASVAPAPEAPAGQSEDEVTEDELDDLFGKIDKG